MIRHLGWIASARDHPVFERVPNSTTVQDEMIMESGFMIDFIFCRVYRNTEISTERDARNECSQRNVIGMPAMSVVKEMLIKDSPIDTVHDHLITTAQYRFIEYKFFLVVKWALHSSTS